VFAVGYELNFIYYLYNPIYIIYYLEESWRVLKAPRTVRKLNMTMCPLGLGTKNHCAGEDRQQFGSQSISRVLRNVSVYGLDAYSPGYGPGASS
jgi:hypothetical protein